MLRAGIVVVGAGAAGLGLAVRLADAGVPGVVLVDSADPAPPRTWCSWQRRPVPWQEAVSASWDEVTVHAPDGRAHRLDLAPYRYEMVRSGDFERWACARLGGVERVTATVEDVTDGPSSARVTGAGLDIDADWVVDTRPAPPSAPGRTRLLQHFRGWWLRTAHDAFDPAAASLMDFRPPQPAGGVAFGYVLPTSRREALVEYTEFGRELLDDAAYDAALRHYAGDVLGLSGHEILAVENGVIPMTDAPFDRRPGRRVLRIGAAGGATRASTGYTFTASQRQAAEVAAALVAGRDPGPRPAYPARHREMDALLLRALDERRIEGAAFFAGMFARHPAPRILAFLDGTSTPRQDLAVLTGAPRRAMLGTLRGHVLASLPARR